MENSGMRERKNEGSGRFREECAKEEHIVLIGLLQKACSLMGPV